MSSPPVSTPSSTSCARFAITPVSSSSTSKHASGARTGIGNLRVEYNRVHGFYIEVTHGQTIKVPDDYRRRQTLKNAERYITPELKTFEDKALSARDRALAREKVLYDDIVAQAAQHVTSLQRCADALASIDALLALANHAERARWVRPQLVDSPQIDVRGARHAVVEHECETYVPNDCNLRPGRRLLVITGPNMGGKSTYMRSIALIALLAYAGSFVPASAATLGPIDSIQTRIGAADDLARGRSTFMVEMTEAAAILNAATEHSLVLMDEIGRGTSTFDGMALAAAIARELVEKNRSMTMFATHYFELTQLAEQHPEIANVHVAAAEANGKVVFLHEVRDGPASKSYGLAVAQLAGVSGAVVRRARSLLAQLEERALGKRPQLDLFASTRTVGVRSHPFRRRAAQATAERLILTRCHRARRTHCSRNSSAKPKRTSAACGPTSAPHAKSPATRAMSADSISSGVASRTSTTLISNRSANPASGWFASSTAMPSAMSVIGVLGGSRADTGTVDSHSDLNAFAQIFDDVPASRARGRSRRMLLRVRCVLRRRRLLPCRCSSSSMRLKMSPWPCR